MGPLSLSKVARSPKSIRIAFSLALIALVVIVGWWDVNHLAGFHWDTDEGTALMQVRMLQAGNPLYREVWSDHPPGLMLSILAAFKVAGNSVEVARSVGVIFSLIGVLAVALIAVQIGGRLGALSAAGLLVLAPNFFWLSRSVNRDLPAISLATLGLAFGVRYLDTDRRRWLAAAGIAFGLGLWVKLIPIFVLLPLSLMVFLRRWDSPRRWREMAGDLILLAATVGLTLLPIFLLFDPVAFLLQVVGTPAQAREAWPPRTGDYIVWMRDYLFREHLALTAFAIFGLVAVVWRRSRAGLVVGLWMFLTIAALLTHRPLWPKHHLSLLLFPTACLAGIGVDGLMRLLRGEQAIWPRSRSVALALGVVALAISAWHLPATVTEDRGLVAPDPFIAAWQAVDFVNQHTAPEDFIVTDVPMIAFRTGRPIPPWIVVASSKRVRTGELTSEEVIAVSEKYKPRAVLLWDDHLLRLTDYIGWMKRNYYRAYRDVNREIWMRFDPATDVPIPRPADLDGQVSLLGYGLDKTELRPGETLNLTLYWRAERDMTENHNVFTHLLDEQGNLWGQHDSAPQQNDYPTSRWASGEPVPDEHPIPLSPDAPPGSYILTAGLYNWQTGERVPAYGPDGSRFGGDEIYLGQVQVVP